MPAIPRSVHPTSVYRPASATVAAVAWTVVTLGWAWLALRDGGVVALARQAPAMALAATVVYAVLVRPAVAVDRDGVRLRNVLQDVEVPWPALERVSTRFALTLHTRDGQRLRAWAAPASGRHVDARLTAGDVRALGLDPDEEAPPASASTASPSGVAAAWVRREWRRARADDAPVAPVARDAPGVVGPATGNEPGAVRRRPARGPLTSFAVFAVLTVVSVLV